MKKRKFFQCLSAVSVLFVEADRFTIVSYLLSQKSDRVLNGTMYQSIPSMTILPLGDPRGFSRYHCPGGRVFAQLSLQGGGGGSGFELEKFPTVLKEKCRNSSICFKETGGSFKSRCSCAVLYRFLQKQ